MSALNAETSRLHERLETFKREIERLQTGTQSDALTTCAAAEWRAEREAAEKTRPSTAPLRSEKG